ncbi:hypothetical protein HZ326_19937 [Fusarium oxysporum f. sp. albedinis]|nr:hypothetical protein HZ326_19937 [Fusarium oxysporum f. sp. albedinis]
MLMCKMALLTKLTIPRLITRKTTIPPWRLLVESSAWRGLPTFDFTTSSMKPHTIAITSWWPSSGPIRGARRCGRGFLRSWGWITPTRPTGSICISSRSLESRIRSPSSTSASVSSITSAKRDFCGFLCIYHINANVRGKISSRWHNPNTSESASPIEEDDTSKQYTGEVDLRARAETQKEAESAEASSELPPLEDTADGMFEAWKRVVYALNESDFFSRWPTMVSTYCCLYCAVVLGEKIYIFVKT